MVTVHEIRGCYTPAGRGKFGWILTTGREDIQQKQSISRSRLANVWKTIKGEFDDKNRKKKQPRGDVSYVDYKHFSCTKYAKIILEPVLQGEGEFLPIETEEGPYFLFHCVNYLDCLVLEECEFDRYEEDDPTSPIRSFSKMVFRPEVIRDAHCFHLENAPGALFLTHNFMRLLKEHNFEGLCPRLMWEESSSPA